MRTRGSPKDQERLYRAGGADLARKAAKTGALAVTWTEPLRAIGRAACPWGRLLGTVSIGGILHHVEAIAVENRDGEQATVLDEDETSFADLMALSDGAMQTLELDGHEYVVVIHPYQR